MYKEPSQPRKNNAADGQNSVMTEVKPETKVSYFTNNFHRSAGCQRTEIRTQLQRNDITGI